MRIKSLILVLLIVSQVSFLNLVHANAIEGNHFGKSYSVQAPGEKLPVSAEFQEAEEETSDDSLSDIDLDLLYQVVFPLRAEKKSYRLHVNKINLQKLNSSVFSLYSTLLI